MRVLILGIFFFIFEVSILSGQSKVLELPRIFNPPVDYDQQFLLRNSLIEIKGGDVVEKIPWMVFSDRSDNKIYNKPGGSVKKIVDFRTLLYVADFKGTKENPVEWLQVIKGSVDGIKVTNIEYSGWIEIDKVLLWNRALVDKSSKISRKILLMNKVEDFKNLLKDRYAGGDKQIVEVYSHPTRNSKTKELRIFSFYYLLKHDYESDRVLIGDVPSINNTFSTEGIIGWVDKRRTEKWNNRVCLEPNFEKEAFNERKENPDRYAIRAFAYEPEAMEYAKGNYDPREVVWEDDPALIDTNLIVQRRLPGSVLRMPMIGRGGRKNSLRTGIVGSIRVIKEEGKDVKVIPEVDFDKLQSATKRTRNFTDNINVYFAIEATPQAQEYRESIISAIRKVKESEWAKNVLSLRFGVLAYRDELEGSRIIEHQPLTDDELKVMRFIQGLELGKYRDYDDWTAMKYGISESLRRAGFAENEGNILIVIGSYGDYSYDRRRGGRLEDARERRYRSLVSDEEIQNSVSRYNVHLYAIQLENDGSMPANSFSALSHSLILESANAYFNSRVGKMSNARDRDFAEVMENNGFQIEVPSIPDYDSGTEIALDNSKLLATLFRPYEGRAVQPEALKSSVYEVVHKTYKHLENVNESVKAMYGPQGKSVKEVMSAAPSKVLEGDMGSFKAAMIDVLYDQYMQEGIDEEYAELSFQEKYKLLFDVYIPKQIEGAKHPTLKYCVFMHQDELIDYATTIEKALTARESEMRNALVEIFKELVANYAGDEALKLKKIDEFTIQELNNLLTGLSNEGLNRETGFYSGRTISDFKNDKIVPKDRVIEVIKKFKDIANRIKVYTRLAENHPFCYQCDSEASFWIPIDDLFIR